MRDIFSYLETWIRGGYVVRVLTGEGTHVDHADSVGLSSLEVKGQTVANTLTSGDFLVRAHIGSVLISGIDNS